MIAERLTAQLLAGEPAHDPLAVVERLLAVQGQDPRERIAAAGVRTEGQALVHLLMLASLRGLIVRGPMVDAQHAFVLVHDWLGEAKPIDRQRALGELAHRYLCGHAPADERDLAKWSGLPLRDVRAGLGAIAPALVQRPDGLLELAAPGLLELAAPARVALAREPTAALPPPRLLGAFDPLLLGWRSREAILGSHRTIVTVNGLFRPFALVRGRAVATWSMPGGEVQLEPFGRIAPKDGAALATDGEDVVRYLTT